MFAVRIVKCRVHYFVGFEGSATIHYSAKRDCFFAPSTSIVCINIGQSIAEFFWFIFHLRKITRIESCDFRSLSFISNAILKPLMIVFFFIFSHDLYRCSLTIPISSLCSLGLTMCSRHIVRSGAFKAPITVTSNGCRRAVVFGGTTMM